MAAQASPPMASSVASIRRIALARAVNLDMAEVGWRPTVDNYLGRVTKTRILEAVREAKGEAAVQLIDHLKKSEMAKEAERLLEDTRWLPEPLRLAEVAPPSDVKRLNGHCRNSSPTTRSRRARSARASRHRPSLPNNLPLRSGRRRSAAFATSSPLCSHEEWQGEGEPGREGFEPPRS